MKEKVAQSQPLVATSMDSVLTMEHVGSRIRISYTKEAVEKSLSLVKNR